MPRVYFDTSFVSACVSRRDDPMSEYRRRISREWLSQQAAAFECVASAEVIAELDRPEFSQRDEALRLIHPLDLIAVNEESIGVAEVLVREKVMPAPASSGDAVHVAVCSVHAVDYLLSWNVRHLANPRKTRHLQSVCRRLGLLPPTIMTPEALWETPP